MKKKLNSWRSEKSKSHEENSQPIGEAVPVEAVVVEAAGVKNNL